MSEDDRKTVTVQIRVSAEEKDAFVQSADIAGLPLSAWVRERLRLAAIRDLETARRRVPFVKPIPLEGSDV